MAGHLTLEEREVVAQRNAEGWLQTDIARELGRDKSTISRELRRNRSPNGYFPARAHQQAEQRRRERPLVRKMEQPELRRLVCDELKKRTPPVNIAGRTKLLFKDKKCRISHQSIYAWIDAQAGLGKQWQRFLKFKGKPKNKRHNDGRLPNATPIDGRPKRAEERKRIGDFEGDTVHGRAGRGGLVTLVDRKSRYTLVEKVRNLKADTVTEACVTALRGVPTKKRHSATFDNGREFAGHEVLARRARVKVYFAEPHAPWQRGTNENTNGLYRQFFPKGTDLARVSSARISQVQELLNHRPRRCLGYLTPHEVFHGIRPSCV
jgi:IS30 family transposase